MANHRKVTEEQVHAHVMKKANKCQAGTPICSGSLIATYGVNGSEKEGQTFQICGACKVYLGRGGTKFKQVQP